MTDSELNERVAIVKRFKALLQEQRKRFMQYLEVLDKQKEIIENGKAEDIISHVELEEKIVADIFAIQKSVEPMQAMFKTAFAAGKNAGKLNSEAYEIPQINTAIENLKVTAVERSTRNKEMLEKRMVMVRNEMKSLRGSSFKRRSVYADPNQPVLIDMHG
ncbi:MAG: hypothetical protein Ta2B_06020 [Termitinemataceae bacterium]|nr:MAG: hypothetical protein Ta2B_06020 [Termitinemataceae bacterium]